MKMMDIIDLLTGNIQWWWIQWLINISQRGFELGQLIDNNKFSFDWALFSNGRAQYGWTISQNSIENVVHQISVY